MSSADGPERIFAILLAAGAGSRFEGRLHKLQASLRGRPVVDWALAAVISSDVAGCIVVTGAVLLELPAEAIAVHNPQWATGQATSLQLGVVAAAERGADAVVIGLGDQPFVTTRAWNEVAGSAAPIAVATYAGVRGHPVRLHRSVWPLLPTAGDHGARELIAQRPELVCEVACTGSSADIDTMEDLHTWNSSTNSP